MTRDIYEEVEAAEFLELVAEEAGEHGKVG